MKTLYLLRRFLMVVSLSFGSFAAAQSGFQFNSGFKYAASQNSDNTYNHFFDLSNVFIYNYERIDLSIEIPVVSQSNNAYTQVGKLILKDSRLNDSAPNNGHIQSSITDGVAIDNLKIGLGDIIIQSNINLFNDNFSYNSININTFIKLPTASDFVNISTNQVDGGISLEIKKQIFNFLTQSVIGYVILGNTDLQELFNPINYSVAIGKSLNNGKYKIFLKFEGYSKIYNNYPSPNELSVSLNYSLTKKSSIEINAATGLSSAVPDFILSTNFNINI